MDVSGRVARGGAFLIGYASLPCAGVGLLVLGAAVGRMGVGPGVPGGLGQGVLRVLWLALGAGSGCLLGGWLGSWPGWWTPAGASSPAGAVGAALGCLAGGTLLGPTAAAPTGGMPTTATGPTSVGAPGLSPAARVRAGAAGGALLAAPVALPLLLSPMAPGLALLGPLAGAFLGPPAAGLLVRGRIRGGGPARPRGPGSSEEAPAARGAKRRFADLGRRGALALGLAAGLGSGAAGLFVPAPAVPLPEGTGSGDMTTTSGPRARPFELASPDGAGRERAAAPGAALEAWIDPRQPSEVVIAAPDGGGPGAIPLPRGYRGRTVHWEGNPPGASLWLVVDAEDGRRFRILLDPAGFRLDDGPARRLQAWLPRGAALCLALALGLAGVGGARALAGEAGGGSRVDPVVTRAELGAALAAALAAVLTATGGGSVG